MHMNKICIFTDGNYRIQIRLPDSSKHEIGAMIYCIVYASYIFQVSVELFMDKLIM